TTKKEFDRVIQEITNFGFKYDILQDQGEKKNPVVGIRDECGDTTPGDFTKFDGVINAQKLSIPYKHVSREYKLKDTIVQVGNINIGGENNIIFMAGPCAVESREQILRIAQEVKDQGATILRGGCWKPRTAARCFEGLKEKGLDYLIEAKELTGLPIVTEVMSVETLAYISERVDLLQVGARNMHNFTLLDELGKQHKPVLLKRGLSATIEEFLCAADRIVYGGNPNVLLCLRGVRTFDNSQRYPADLYAIPDLIQKTHLPIIFDPSHPAGRRSLVPSLAKMAIAGGVNGLIIESHYEPQEAKCDGAQMITPEVLGKIINYAKQVEHL
ncbi:3-deoxy-7-phosphoheptulonate synthase, partial [Candidatus Woesearchaeota archaeon CG10_big_fil_rev_8_21_14_0_10_30_7]